MHLILAADLTWIKAMVDTMGNFLGWATKGEVIMNDNTIGFDQTEAEFPTADVSDEALESAGGAAKEKAGSLTLAFCSGLDTCPGVVT